MISIVDVLNYLWFKKLKDTPNSYSGYAGKFLRVKSTEDGLEFAEAESKRAVTYVVSANNTAVGKDEADYVCDGVNDEATIQDAIDNAPNGATIVLRQGTYNIANPININKNIKLIGEKEAILIGNEVFSISSDCLVKGVHVDANRGIYIEGGRIILDNVEVVDATTGVEVVPYTTYAFFRGCRFENCEVAIKNSSIASLQVSANMFENTSDYAINDTQGQSKIVVANNVFYGGKNSISLTGWGSVISANQFINTTGRVRPATASAVSGNSFRGCDTDYAIYIDRPYVTVTGNSFYVAGTTTSIGVFQDRTMIVGNTLANTYKGVYVDAKSVVVGGNYIYSPGQDAIFISSESSNVKLALNLYVGNITDNASDTEYIANLKIT